MPTELARDSWYQDLQACERQQKSHQRISFRLLHTISHTYLQAAERVKF